MKWSFGNVLGTRTGLSWGVVAQTSALDIININNIDNCSEKDAKHEIESDVALTSETAGGQRICAKKRLTGGNCRQLHMIQSLRLSRRPLNLNKRLRLRVFLSKDWKNTHIRRDTRMRPAPHAATEQPSSACSARTPGVVCASFAVAGCRAAVPGVRPARPRGAAFAGFCLSYLCVSLRRSTDLMTAPTSDKGTRSRRRVNTACTRQRTPMPHGRCPGPHTHPSLPQLGTEGLDVVLGQARHVREVRGLVSMREVPLQRVLQQTRDAEWLSVL